jgi:hypothetical protein
MYSISAGGLVVDVCTGGLVVIRSPALERDCPGGGSVPVLPGELERLREALAEAGRRPEVLALGQELRKVSDGLSSE